MDTGKGWDRKDQTCPGCSTRAEPWSCRCSAGPLHLRQHHWAGEVLGSHERNPALLGTHPGALWCGEHCRLTLMSSFAAVLTCAAAAAAAHPTATAMAPQPCSLLGVSGSPAIAWELSQWPGGSLCCWALSAGAIWLLLWTPVPPKNDTKVSSSMPTAWDTQPPACVSSPQASAQTEWEQDWKQRLLRPPLRHVHCQGTHRLGIGPDSVGFLSPV